VLTAASHSGTDLTVTGTADYGTRVVALTGTATVGNGTDAGSLTAGDVTALHFDVAGGSATINSLAGLDADVSTVSVAADQTLDVNLGITNVKTLTVDGTATLHSLSDEGTANETSIVRNLAINGAGTLDVTMGNVIVKDSTQLVQIRDWLRTAANFDVDNTINWWDGTGITSSTVRDGDVYLYSVGMRSADEDPVGAYGAMTEIEGVSLDLTDIVVKYTYAGDANLDGKVDGDDYTVLDYYYSTIGTPEEPSVIGWWNGDLNHDGKIDGDDYTLLDYSFSTYWLNFDEQITNPDLTTPLPEPATMGLMVLGLAAMAALRRRSK
jgi:hypothetical protein